MYIIRILLLVTIIIFYWISGTGEVHFLPFKNGRGIPGAGWLWEIMPNGPKICPDLCLLTCFCFCLIYLVYNNSLTWFMMFMRMMLMVYNGKIPHYHGYHYNLPRSWLRMNVFGCFLFKCVTWFKMSNVWSGWDVGAVVVCGGLGVMGYTYTGIYLVNWGNSDKRIRIIKIHA